MIYLVSRDCSRDIFGGPLGGLAQDPTLTVSLSWEKLYFKGRGKVNKHRNVSHSFKKRWIFEESNLVERDWWDCKLQNVDSWLSYLHFINEELRPGRVRPFLFLIWYPLLSPDLMLFSWYSSTLPLPIFPVKMGIIITTLTHNFIPCAWHSAWK